MTTDWKTRLDEIKERVDRTTPGEWRIIGGAEYATPIGLLIGDGVGSVRERDAKFIVHARKDVPDLVTALESVLELHAPRPVLGDCADCSQLKCSYCCTSYPCKTVRTINDALENR